MMEKYMWRVLMNDGSREMTTVALFLLQSDAHEWAQYQNKKENIYTIGAPIKELAT